jgi:hypothetical protein
MFVHFRWNSRDSHWPGGPARTGRGGGGISGPQEACIVEGQGDRRSASVFCSEEVGVMKPCSRRACGLVLQDCRHRVHRQHLPRRLDTSLSRHRAGLPTWVNDDRPEHNVTGARSRRRSAMATRSSSASSNSTRKARPGNLAFSACGQIEASSRATLSWFSSTGSVSEITFARWTPRLTRPCWAAIHLFSARAFSSHPFPSVNARDQHGILATRRHPGSHG